MICLDLSGVPLPRPSLPTRKRISRGWLPGWVILTSATAGRGIIWVLWRLTGWRSAIGVGLDERRFKAHLGRGAIDAQAVMFAQPQTFMNSSGDAVAPILGYFKIEARRV